MELEFDADVSIVSENIYRIYQPRKIINFSVQEKNIISAIKKIKIINFSVQENKKMINFCVYANKNY